MGDMAKKKVEKKSLAEREAERAARRQEIQNDNETIAYISGQKIRQEKKQFQRE